MTKKKIKIKKHEKVKSIILVGRKNPTQREELGIIVEKKIEDKLNGKDSF